MLQIIILICCVCKCSIALNMLARRGGLSLVENR